jgi:hypothetical protein
MRFLACVITTLLAVAAAVPVPFSSCGAGEFTASSVDVSPFPPQRGQTVHITTTGHLASSVTGGNFEVDVMLAGVTVLKQTGDMCSFSPDLKCPQAAGDLTAGYDISVPAIAPSGNYTIVFHGTQQDGKTLFCVQSNFEIASAWGEANAAEMKPVGTSVPFSTCDSGVFSVSNVDTTPYPPVKGQSVKIVASGTLAEQITSGSFEVDVSIGGVVVLKKTGDLCSLSSSSSCPAAAGPLTVSYDMDVPSIAPDGQYTLTFKAIQQTGKTVVCLTSNFELKSTWASDVYALDFVKPPMRLIGSSIPFTSCGAGDFVANEIDVSPWPVARGQDITITASGNLKSVVTAGSYDIDVTLGGVSVLKDSGDLCKFSPDASCPAQPGAITLSHIMSVPAIAPSGTYIMTVKGTQQDSKVLFCVQGQFSL